jgi:hypothetical protein
VRQLVVHPPPRLVRNLGRGRRLMMPLLLKKVPDWLLLVLLGKAVGTLLFM